jgi:hypothetical protein
MLESNFINPNLKLDAFHDLGYYIQLSLGIPTVIIVLARYFNKLPRVILKLSLSENVDISKNEYNEFIEFAQSKYKKKIFVLLPLLAGFIISFIGTLSYILGTTESWNSNSTASLGTYAGWSITPFVFFLYYCIALILVRISITFIILKKYFEFPFKIQPLHPDKCGGLSPLGSLSLSLNIGTFLFGIICALGIYASIHNMGLPWYHYVHFLIIIGYFVGAYLLFFLPLKSAHQKMKNAKNEAIQILNQRFNVINNKLVTDIKNSKELSRKEYDNLEIIRELYNMASKMPVYPYDFHTVTSFLGSTIAPIIFILLEIILNKFL